MSTCSSVAAPVTHSWLAVIAVGLATFAVVTTEMLPVGLLTPISATLQVSTGTAGLMISLPALLAALFAAVVVLASAGVDRRTLLCGLLGLLLIANVASALAPSMAWMLAARTLVGFCIGGIWAIAGGLAARLVPGHAVGLATSVIFGGVAAASVLGVPLGAMVGELAGWRWAFALMALFTGLVLALHLAVLPALPAPGATGVRQFVQQLGNRKLQAGLLLTLLLVTGHFAAFTFARPLLHSVSGFDERWIGPLLLAYGVAGMIGNFVAGTWAARHAAPALMAIAAGLLLAATLYLVIGGSSLGGVVSLLVWGLAYGGVSVGLMTLMMKVVPDTVEIAAALYVGTFNLAIALGAWLGGQAVDLGGLGVNLWLLAGFAGCALVLGWGVYRSGRQGA